MSGLNEISYSGPVETKIKEDNEDKRMRFSYSKIEPRISFKDHCPLVYCLLEIKMFQLFTGTWNQSDSLFGIDENTRALSKLKCQRVPAQACMLYARNKFKIESC